MFTKIRYRMSLAVVISIIPLFPGWLRSKTLSTEQFATVEREVITLQIRQYPENRRPWNRGDVIRVRVDIDRLRAYDLSIADVVKALEESGIVFSPRPVPPPWVIFNTGLGRPELYNEIIVSANAEGKIVRLKDVATVEGGR